MNDLVLCLGVGNIDNKVSYVHLLRMEDPLSVLTRRSQKDDEFSIGKWYREESGQPRSYKYINNIVPTKVIRHIDINCSGKTTIELVLPVFFAPDLSGMEVFGHTPVMKNQNYLGVPICPFFGLDGNEIISPVKWSYGFCSYSDQLYALKINLSYAVGEPPEWTPQNVGIIKPWNYEEVILLSHVFALPREMKELWLNRLHVHGRI
ncbi:hypothetical protein Mgra_00005386 [Meloidogyne graminicola]|uniref:Uncharacterized protein n=1 Tax=Meloidogyne graminicola TaxID=189291 RepID=A0A8S9ZPT2_9BILA|nr:hypothetical protein Mgra_00005386 [Meloidogyne graminicola]